MSHTFKNTKKGFRGFTLIELLVVIAIIGLLSTVIAAPITQARKKGRDGKKVADLHQLVGGLQQYADDNTSNFPPSLDGLVPLYLAILPPFAATSTASKDKYMYSLYLTRNDTPKRAVGFHLGVKLEAANQALGDDRDCHGVGTITTANAYCQDLSADSASQMDITAGNMLTAALASGADFANDANVAGTAATFQPQDFQGGNDTASSTCNAAVKSSAANAVTCVYDITN